MNESEGLWVCSDIAPDGTYVVTVNLDDDLAFTLDETDTFRYIRYIWDVVARAEHDAAVVAQLKDLVGLELDELAMALKDIRTEHRPLPIASEWPVSFVGMVSHRDLIPRVTIHMKGKPVGQVDTADLIGHAVGVMDALATVDLDAGYYTWLVTECGLPEHSARGAVGALYRYRHRT